MFALFDKEFRRARGAARSLINLYESLRKDSAFDARIRKVVGLYNEHGRSRSFDKEFYFFFLHDIGQCHRILGVPFESERFSSMAALIFIAHVFDYDATVYSNYLKIKTSPDVMKPFFALFEDACTLASENPDKMALLSGLEGYDREEVLNCALVFDTYGRYVREMEGVDSTDYKRYDKVLKDNAGILSTSDTLTAIEEEVRRGIRQYPVSSEPSADSPAGQYKTRRAPEGYYGMNGEFDVNDESRRVSEDIEQFANAHPDADVKEHYYWDDILDAETDDYIKPDDK